MRIVDKQTKKYIFLDKQSQKTISNTVVIKKYTIKIMFDFEENTLKRFVLS